MKTAMTRQCNIKSEDGDYSDRLDDDAYTSGPKWYSLKSVASVRVCSVMHDELRILDD